MAGEAASATPANTVEIAFRILMLLRPQRLPCSDGNVRTYYPATIQEPGLCLQRLEVWTLFGSYAASRPRAATERSTRSIAETLQAAFLIMLKDFLAGFAGDAEFRQGEAVVSPSLKRITKTHGECANTAPSRCR